jgi:hypothetical protein
MDNNSKEANSTITTTSTKISSLSRTSSPSLTSRDLPLRITFISLDLTLSTISHHAHRAMDHHPTPAHSQASVRRPTGRRLLRTQRRIVRLLPTRPRVNTNLVIHQRHLSNSVSKELHQVATTTTTTVTMAFCRLLFSYKPRRSTSNTKVVVQRFCFSFISYQAGRQNKKR